MLALLRNPKGGVGLWLDGLGVTSQEQEFKFSLCEIGKRLCKLSAWVQKHLSQGVPQNAFERLRSIIVLVKSNQLVKNIETNQF